MNRMPKHVERVRSTARLKHGIFHSLVDLQAAINRFVREYNAANPQPFIWKPGKACRHRDCSARKAGGRTDGGEDATDLTDTMFMERAASSVELVTLPLLFRHPEVGSVLVIVVGRTGRPLQATLFSRQIAPPSGGESITGPWAPLLSRLSSTKKADFEPMVWWCKPAHRDECAKSVLKRRKARLRSQKFSRIPPENPGIQPV